MAEFHLTSTPIDLSGVSGAELRFQRWLGVERNAYDHARVRISANGTSFTQIWENGDTSINDTAWSLQTFDISALDGSPAARLRWSMGTTDGSVTYQGWNIDDVEIVGFTALNASPADINGDGFVDFGDVSAFLAAFIAGEPTADINGDGVIDFGDVSAFVTAFNAG
jgi:Immune inhibitor A peptidase M6.